MTIFALLGSGALFLTYAWLASAIAGAYLSSRKGYGERPGLASGLLLNALGPIIWLFWPAKEHSLWKTVGPWGSRVKSEQATSASAPPTTSTEPGPEPDPRPPSADTTGRP